MARLTWHGHSCFTLVTDDARIMFDPWLDDNPAADIGTGDVDDLDYILVSHGHFDHFGDGVELATQTGATIVGTFELVAFAREQGVENGHGMNIGGGHEFPFGYAKMTPAEHSASIVGDDDGSHPTVAGGWWIELSSGVRFYHAGDTALTADLGLLKGRVDIALLPIGDNFTMGPDDAARAVEMIEPGVVIPMHYNTFDLIKQDPVAWASDVGDTADVVVLEPGDDYEF